MTDGTIYKHIAERTGGEIHVGVVGPVRTGKSTFIKRFMELFVVPGIEDPHMRERVVDVLPQSGDGRTITTTEPKFIPEEAVSVKVGAADLAIRLIDCVGYLVPGVLGHVEDGRDRMVKTPWRDGEIPFAEAAALGTEKVIQQHATVGILVTADGSFGELSREQFSEAEEKTVRQLKELGKPFVIVLNSSHPHGAQTRQLAEALEEQYATPVVAADCARMDHTVPARIFDALLQEFPATEILISLPDYMDALPPEHRIKAELVEVVRGWMHQVRTVYQVRTSVQCIAACPSVKQVTVTRCEMATGKVYVEIMLQDGLYYEIVGELLHRQVRDDRALFLLLEEYARAKEAYDDLEAALAQVEQTGYGIVHPKLSQMHLGEPEVFHQGSKYGVRMVASAPCLHVIRTEVTTELSPIVGSEQQSADLAGYLMEKFRASGDERDLWETNLFGKSLQELVTEQIEGKLTSMPASLQGKVQRSLQRISNEGKDYFICIIL